MECSELTRIIDDKVLVEVLLASDLTRENTEKCIPTALRDMLDHYARNVGIVVPPLTASQVIQYLIVIWHRSAGCNVKLVMAARRGLIYLLPMLLSPRSLERRTLSTYAERMLGQARPEICANINTRQGLPLRHAVARNDTDMVRLLLDMGAYPKNEAIAVAVVDGNLDMVKILAPYISRPGITRAITLAYQYGYTDIANFLVNTLKSRG